MVDGECSVSDLESTVIFVGSAIDKLWISLNLAQNAFILNLVICQW